MNDLDPSIMYWHGRPLVELSRDELLQVIVFQHEQFLLCAANFDALNAMNDRLIQDVGGRA